jgi:hypothetical protein
MTETVRCWLVERMYDDKGLIRIVYAPSDGTGRYVTEKAAASDPDVTAAIDVEAGKLEAIDDASTRERYAEEAARMAERHGPDETV